MKGTIESDAVRLAIHQGSFAKHNAPSGCSVPSIVLYDVDVKELATAIFAQSKPPRLTIISNPWLDTMFGWEWQHTTKDGLTYTCHINEVRIKT